MQGNLNEIDIRSILQLIELGQRTGELFVESYSDSYTPNQDTDPSLGLHSSPSLPTRSWFVFFFNGQIIYATDSNTNLLRLRDYLYHYQVAPILDTIQVSGSEANNLPEYNYLWALLEHNFLTPSQGRSILRRTIHETLFDLLSLHQGTFIFESVLALAPQLMTLKISSTVTKIMSQVQQWKQLHPQITSVHQCPLITEEQKLQQSLPASTFNHLEHWIDGKTSLRQLTRYLNRDLVTVAIALYPFIQKGWVQLVTPPATNTPSSPGFSPLAAPKTVKKIVCIHEDLTLAQTFKSTLSEVTQLEVICIGDRPSALSLLFQIKPDLIFCELTAPGSAFALDGYEFCAMLRRSTIFRHTPMILLGENLLIQQIKARMLGATDYLIAPVTEKKLLILLAKHLNFPGIISTSFTN